MAVQKTHLFDGTTYLINPDADLDVLRGHKIDVRHVVKAVDKAHETVTKLSQFDVDVAALLGMRNLSAFVGEIFAASMIKVSDGLYRKNPHQDGYPDLLLMDSAGQKLWASLSEQLRDKNPFSPFETQGIEIKATCGSVPTPAQCQKKGLYKPDIGDERIGLLSGYDWKAHHQETNRLMGIFWDFIDRKPSIVAVFYSPKLTRSDWGNIIKPKDGGGRTTSVSIMTRGGVAKMYKSWVLMRDDDRYINFFKKYNKAD